MISIEEPLSIDSQYTGYSKYKNNTPTVFMTSGDRALHHRINWKQSTSNKNFKKRRAAGEIFKNDYYRVREEFIAANNIATWQSTNSDTRNYFEGEGSLNDYYLNIKYPTVTREGDFADRLTIGYIQGVVNPLMDRCKFEAISRMDKTAYEFGEDVAEVSKTLALMHAPLQEGVDHLSKALAKAYGHRRASLKNVSLAALKSLPALGQTASAVWLKTNFGYATAFRSALNALELEATKEYSAKPTRRTSRWTLPFEKDLTALNCVVRNGSNTEVVHFDHALSLSGKVSAGILYETTSPINSWRAAAGLRLKDIPSTLWAVTPLSWAIDMAVDVGGMVQGLTNLSDPSLRILAAWNTYNWEGTETIQIPSGSVYNSTNSVTYVPGVDTVINNQKSRYNWIPSITDVVPPVKLKELKDNAFGTSLLLAQTVLLLSKFRH
jgi:hypothetical protein